jgi:hypothetical protein
MLWEFMRDAGLMSFAFGGALFFGVGKDEGRTPQIHILDPSWIKPIGDCMMFGGACLSLIAMLGRWIWTANY